MQLHHCYFKIAASPHLSQNELGAGLGLMVNLSEMALEARLVHSDLLFQIRLHFQQHSSSRCWGLGVRISSLLLSILMVSDTKVVEP